MSESEIFIYINGACAAMYLLTCLICGLQLSFHLFMRHSIDTPSTLSKSVGYLMFGFGASAVCYILSDIFPAEEWLSTLGCVIDFMLLTGIAAIGHIIIQKIQPSLRQLCILAMPFTVLAVLFFLLPDPIAYWVPVGGAGVLIVLFVYDTILLRHREKSLADIYSNPDAHSLGWLNITIFFFVGWIILFIIIYSTHLFDWIEVILFSYMTLIFLFVFAKVSNYAEPVSISTQQEMDQIDWNETHISSTISQPLQEKLIALLNEQQIYLNPDLTVDDVVKLLQTNTKYLSVTLHHEMHTTFSHLINEYRVARAKELLCNPNEKVVNLPAQCGFHSAQAFYYTFAKFTGNTPSEWRKKQ